MAVLHHLVMGGQRSGKSRHAERLAMRWLQQSPRHRVTVVATATASDDEMRQRIERHRLDRPPAFDTVEAPVHLARALRELAAPQRLFVVDCLTLWLANVLMPWPEPGLGQVNEPGLEALTLAPAMPPTPQPPWPELRADLLQALRGLDSPVVLVSNDIGGGVIPMGAQVRHFVDEMGRLNQDVAQCCAHLTLMAAGQPFTRDVEHWA